MRTQRPSSSCAHNATGIYAIAGGRWFSGRFSQSVGAAIRIGVSTECGQRNIVVLGGATERDYLCCRRRHTRKTATNVRLRDERRRRTVEQRRTARYAFAIDADRLRLINTTTTKKRTSIVLLFINIIIIYYDYYYCVFITTRAYVYRYV